mmetsp:Transcript_2534/g.5306  ORF Transcript_2534/g.5306 Transcript_2534/m.5306 type:complete len:204 (+) Transcript_2534:329-940(+)
MFPFPSSFLFLPFLLFGFVLLLLNKTNSVCGLSAPHVVVTRTPIWNSKDNGTAHPTIDTESPRGLSRGRPTYFATKYKVSTAVAQRSFVVSRPHLRIPPDAGGEHLRPRSRCTGCTTSPPDSSSFGEPFRCRHGLFHFFWLRLCPPTIRTKGTDGETRGRSNGSGGALTNERSSQRKPSPTSMSDTPPIWSHVFEAPRNNQKG